MKGICCSNCEGSCTVYNERHNRCPYCGSKLFELREGTELRAHDDYQDTVRTARGRWETVLYVMAVSIAVPPLLVLGVPYAFYQFVRGILDFRKGRQLRRAYDFGPVPVYDDEHPPPKYAGIVTPQ